MYSDLLRECGLRRLVVLGLLVCLTVSMVKVQTTIASPGIINVPDDYGKIQWAIGNATAGDTIRVHAGTFYENIIIDKPLFLVGDGVRSTIIDGAVSGSDFVVKITSNHTSVSGFCVRNALAGTGKGVWVILCNNCTITDNLIFNCDIGIDIDGSYGNYVARNRITKCTSGIFLFNAFSSHFENNILLDNLENGFNLGWACDNTLENNLIENATTGLYLCGNRQTVYGNKITDCQTGIELSDLYSCENNTFYHNSFINNTQQVKPTLFSPSSINSFDRGWPDGGNYWSSHNNVDVKSGPMQGGPGSDGIADVSFFINAQHTDNFPCAGSTNYFDVDYNGPREVPIISNSTVSDFSFNSSEGTLKFRVTGDSGTGFCRVDLPNDLVSGLWQNSYKVLVDGVPIAFGNWTAGSTTYIYFRYSHSSRQIVIAPEGDEYFYYCSYTAFDSNGDVFWDAVQVDMDVDTTYSGSLNVYVYAYLRDPLDDYVAFDDPLWSITSTAVEWGQALLYLPPGSPEGLYDIELFLFDEYDKYEDHWILYDQVYLLPPDMMELTIEVEGSGTTDPAPGSWWVPNGTVFFVDAIPDAGWMLDHWLLDSVAFDPDDPFPVTMDANHVLRGVFVEIPPDTHELLIEVLGNGTTIPSPGSHAYPDGTVVTVEAFPDTGWTLDHWMLNSVDQGSVNPINVTMDTNHVLAAVLAPPTQFQLIVGTAGSGDTDPAPGSYLHPDGTEVLVTAFPDAGWMLDHWLMDGVDVGQDNPFVVFMDDDHNLTSVFVETPPDMRELTIEVAGSGTTDPAPGSHMYSVGTVVPVDAIPDAGWMLDHWLMDSVAFDPDDPFPVTMDANHVLVAVFAETTPAPATIIGTVLYNEKPISDFTNEPAVFWALDESTGEVFPISPSYDPFTGEYSIPDVPPGEYGISVFIDDALPLNGEHGYAGDFDGWDSPIVVPEGQPVINKNLTVVRTLHLTLPVDNAAIIGYMGTPRDTYPPEEITFKWDALAEASSYQATITEYEEPSTYVKTVTDTSTSNVEWNVLLPINEENHFYVFDLYAYNINELLVGKLMVPYYGGYGWDYRFRISPEAVIESCDPAGDQKDLFDLGETVYITGGNYSPSTTYNFSIVVDEEAWSDGMAIPERVPETVTTVSSNIDGDIPPTAVWSDPQTVGKYDMVVDVNGNGQYDVGIDVLDDNDIEVTAGFSVIPEFPSFIVPQLFMIAALLAVAVNKSRSRKGNTR